LILSFIDISFYPAKMGSVDKAKPSVRVGRKATGGQREIAWDSGIWRHRSLSRLGCRRKGGW